ncbi:MAG: DUF2937 family protein [Stappiaceae bacterium]
MIARILMLIVAVGLGTTASQLPEFSQQYRQRLGGAIDELAKITNDFAKDARAFGLSVEQAIDRLAQNTDDIAAARGDRMRQTLSRLDSLKEQKEAFAEAGPFARLAVFAQNIDTELAEATAKDFEPAVPVTIEGLVTAGSGFFAGWFGVRLILSLFRRRRRRDAEPDTG